MMRQIKILTKLELCNFFSLNVIKNTKDKQLKKKSVVLGVVIAMLVVALMFYCGAMSYSFIKIGAKDIVPAYIVFMTTIFSILFTLFKASSIIFNTSCNDILTSMPISRTALVTSRFIRLYIEGLVVACVVMMPGLFVYVFMVKPGTLATILGGLSVFVVPIIPVTLSVLLGVVITGISSRMKYKSLFEALAAIILIVLMFVGAGMLPATETGNIDIHAIEPIAKKLFDKIEEMYPPTGWFADALREGNITGFAMGTFLSFTLLAMAGLITIINYDRINMQIHTNTAKHNYKLGELQTKTVMKTLVTRELKRYFSSSTYVVNTIMGPVMSLAFAVSLLFYDMSVAFEGLPITINVDNIAPVLFAGILVMNSPISTSISMEGKEFWIIRTLPVKDSDILKSKLLFNTFLLAPFYLLGEVLMIIALKPTIAKGIWMIIVPALLGICSLIIGLHMNLKFPKLNWQSDVEIVKQSASAAIGGFAGVVICLICAILMLLLPVKYYNLGMFTICLILTMIIFVVNSKNNKFELKKLS